jgi:hypothetical protein
LQVPFDIFDQHEQFKNNYIVMDNTPIHKKADIKKKKKKKISSLVKAVFIFRLTPLSSTQLNSFGQYVKVSLKEKSFRKTRRDRLEMKIHATEFF